MSEPSQASDRILTSWKEIANYFKREVRTVQLWEKQEGLPVHRHLHRRQASVYAYPAELEKWWKERGAGGLERTDPESVDPGQPIEEAAESATSLDAQTDVVVAARGSRRRVWMGGGVVAALLLTAGAIWFKAANPAATPTEQTFGAVRLIADPNVMKGYAAALDVDDINGDGRDDFIFSVEPKYTELRIRLGRAEGADSITLSESDVVIRGSGRGSMAANVVDANGDGLRDLIVSEVLYEPYTYNGNGDTFIFWGRRHWPKSLQVSDADVTIRINASSDVRLNACPTWKGSQDLNGDGIEDLILNASEYTEAGRRSAGGVFIFWGRRAWPGQVDVLADADVRLVGARTGEGLGGPCNTGDFNGDGRVDLALYGSGQTLWEMRGRRGRAYLFLGAGRWPRRVDTASKFDMRIDADHEIRDSQFLLADVNGDDKDDVLLFHSKNKSDTQAGEIMAWLGGSLRRGVVTEAEADLRIETEWPKLDFGSSLQSADVDADGIEDILLATPQDGRVTMIYGRREWHRQADMAEYSPVTLFQGEPGAAQFRIWVRDTDADLLPEVVLWSAANSAASKQAVGWIVNLHQELALDVRPSHEPNILYLPEGMLVAGIKGQRQAAGEIVDVATVRLAGAAPTEHVIKDYDGDGIADLQFYFETATMRVTPETKRVVLMARTRDGRPASATDSVTVVMKSAARSGGSDSSPD